MRIGFFLGLSSILIVLFSFDSIAGTCPNLMKGSDSRTLWRLSPYQPARGVALVVHGLNNNPARMVSIENVLRENRIDVLRVALSGHNNNLNVFKHVTAEMWERDALRAYCQANERAKKYGMPLYYVGYSLGGVIGVTISSKYQHVHFDKMVLFAPAVAIRRTAFIMRILSTLNPLTIIPNLFNREGYFANSTGTPVSAYRATFELANFANRHPKRKAINVPTLLFIDPLDELISPSGLRTFIANYRLDEWKTFMVHKRPFSWQSIFHHLMIDPASVGQRRWQEMKAAMVDHLEGRNFTPDHMLSSTPEWEESFYELSDQIIQR